MKLQAEKIAKAFTDPPVVIYERMYHDRGVWYVLRSISNGVDTVGKKIILGKD